MREVVYDYAQEQGRETCGCKLRCTFKGLGGVGQEAHTVTGRNVGRQPTTAEQVANASGGEYNDGGVQRAAYAGEGGIFGSKAARTCCGRRRSPTKGGQR